MQDQPNLDHSHTKRLKNIQGYTLLWEEIFFVNPLELDSHKIDCNQNSYCPFYEQKARRNNLVLLDLLDKYCADLYEERCYELLQNIEQEILSTYFYRDVLFNKKNMEPLKTLNKFIKLLEDKNTYLTQDTDNQKFERSLLSYNQDFVQINITLSSFQKEISAILQFMRTQKENIEKKIN